MLTVEQIEQIVPDQAAEWTDAFNKWLPEYNINTLGRVVCFLAQVYHESAGFTRVEENLMYSAKGLRKTFRKYFPNDTLAKQYQRKPQMIASRVYGNRLGNGPEETGDGYTYRGRGLIQLTGKYNYEAFANDHNMPLDEVVDYLVTIEGALRSACWFWNRADLNQYADQGDMETITRRINGGLNGYEDRLVNYERIYNILSEDISST